MKSLSKLKGAVLGMFVFAFFLLFSFTPRKADARIGVSISFQTFYDNLSPYGTWFNDPQYGYVWAPRVDRGFRPYYSDGYWVNTDYGNMWMSDYPWGWAAFHYGRWVYNEMYGWIWVPGDEWGPAWVTWRQGSGYFGWAPMGPGININISFGSGYYVPDPYWTFIPYGHLYGRNFHRYYAPRRTTIIIRNTTVIHNTYVNNRNTYVTGPRRSDVERITGRSVRTYQVGNLGSEGRGRIMRNSVAVYRPSVSNHNNGSNVAPRPRQVKVVDRQAFVEKRSVSTERTQIQTQPNQRRSQYNGNLGGNSGRSIQADRNISNSRKVERESVDRNAVQYQQPVRSNAREYQSANVPASRGESGRSMSSNSNHFSAPNVPATERRSYSRSSSNESRTVERSNVSNDRAMPDRRVEARSRTENKHSESRSFR